MQNIKDYAQLFLKGIAMGGADIIPGVSGGTIAFITGIYERLLNAIKSIDAEALKLLAALRIKEFWQHIDGKFLITLLLGILVSILSLAQLISVLLEQYPVQLWSFFFGLIVIASFSVAREIKRWNGGVLLAGFIGIAIAYFITVASPSETPTALWFIFLSGAIAICAMILPGISGSFILLILGKYTYIINAIKELDILTIIVFGLGCVVGLLSFSRVVSWLLKRHHDVAVSLLAGFMLGSLNKIWPWKIVTEYRIDSHGVEQPFLTKNVMPTEYFTQTGQEPFIMQALLFAMLGVGIVVILEKIAARNKKVVKSV
jgi:putative membrane protein